MRLPIYQVDAFTDNLFGGNPAAVCPLDAWLPDATMQAIAAENNLYRDRLLRSRQGAITHCAGSRRRSRWTCAGTRRLPPAMSSSAFLQPQRDSVRFRTAKAGTLVVSKRADMLVMDFPARPATPSAAPPGLLAALGGAPREVLRARDHLVVYDSPADIAALKPDLAALATWTAGRRS